MTLHAAECDALAVMIGLVSILIGFLTFGYVRDDPPGLSYPFLWGVAHILSGGLAIYAVLWRIKGHATAGALIAGFAFMRAIVLAAHAFGPSGGDAEWRNTVGIVLWLGFAASTATAWTRVIARHVAWNRLTDEQVHDETDRIGRK